MKTLHSWLMWWRARRATRQLAVRAFRAKYPAGLPQRVETVAEDDKSWVVQVLHGSACCRMASFWDVSKADFAARELHASELSRFFASSKLGGRKNAMLAT